MLKTLKIVGLCLVLFLAIVIPGGYFIISKFQHVPDKYATVTNSKTIAVQETTPKPIQETPPPPSGWVLLNVETSIAKSPDTEGFRSRISLSYGGFTSSCQAKKLDGGSYIGFSSKISTPSEESESSFSKSICIPAYANEAKSMEIDLPIQEGYIFDTLNPSEEGLPEFEYQNPYSRGIATIINLGLKKYVVHAGVVGIIACGDANCTEDRLVQTLDASVAIDETLKGRNSSSLTFPYITSIGESSGISQMLSVN